MDFEIVKPMANVRVEDIIFEQKKNLELLKLTGEIGYKNIISSEEIFNFTNYLFYSDEKFECSGQIAIINKYDFNYLSKIEFNIQKTIFDKFINFYQIPCFIISDNLFPADELINYFNDIKIPLYSSQLRSTELISKLSVFLSNKIAPNTIMHGVLVEVYGMGILMIGKSGIGKSETALELLGRGHRLVADDIVEIKISGDNLIGKGSEQIKHHMEIRGLGIINIKSMYGIGAIKESTMLDAIIELEEWNAKTEYDRLGLEEKTIKILGIEVSKYLIPVKTGRTLATIIEVAAMNQRLKKMGYFSAREFNKKLMNWIQQNDNAIR